MKAVQSTLLVFCGAGLGAVARFWLASFVHVRFPSVFPWPTLVVNTSGSVLIGVAMAWLLAKGDEPTTRLLLVTGVLGGYTTYSAFAYETVDLFVKRHTSLAFAYVLATNILCVLGCWLGSEAGKRLFKPSF